MNIILAIALTISAYFICPPCPATFADCPAACVRVSDANLVFVPFVAAP